MERAIPDNFPAALEKLFTHEGGESNDPDDKGGHTRYGVSLRFLKQIKGDVNGDGHVDSADIRALTPETAAGFYQVHFWDHYRLGEIRAPEVAAKALSFYVNMRGKVAARVFQRALRSCGVFVIEDGIVGTGTLNALNSTFTAPYLAAVRSEAAGTYRQIVANNSSQRKFLGGWLNRAYSK